MAESYFLNKLTRFRPGKETVVLGGVAKCLVQAGMENVEDFEGVDAKKVAATLSEGPKKLVQEGILVSFIQANQTSQSTQLPVDFLGQMKAFSQSQGSQQVRTPAKPVFKVSERVAALTVGVLPSTVLPDAVAATELHEKSQAQAKRLERGPKPFCVPRRESFPPVLAKAGQTC